MELNLIIPAFIAGVLTFLAPCTLPLVPGYLAFISGVSLEDLKDQTRTASLKRKIFINGLFYVLGFSVIFIILGSLFGLGGAALIKYRLWLGRIGGVFVIFFGLFMLGVLRPAFLSLAKPFFNLEKIRPGTPISSFIFGSTFAFGWTPCIGPILGSILFLASSTTTLLEGALLLAIFSLGLALPFLLIAISIGSAYKYLSKLDKTLKIISIIGGIFLLTLGILLVTNNYGSWIGFIYRLFDFLNYNKLLDYL